MLCALLLVPCGCLTSSAGERSPVPRVAYVAVVLRLEKLVLPVLLLEAGVRVGGRKGGCYNVAYLPLDCFGLLLFLFFVAVVVVQSYQFTNLVF